MAEKILTGRFTQKKPAFTLVELIVVITILAVLATVGFLALQGYTKDAKDSATKTNVRTVAQAVELESAAGGASVRRFASFSGAYAMSGKVLGAVLSGGTVGTAGTNYTPGPVDFAALKLDSGKFAADGSQYLMSAVDVPEKLVTGKTRTRTLFQIAALAGTTAYVEGTFSSALAASSATGSETTVTGIIADPNAGTGGTVALSSNLDTPTAGGGSSGGSTSSSSTSSTSGGPSDSFWAQTVLASRMEGAWVEKGTAFTSVSGPAVTNSEFKFWAWSMDFTSAGYAYSNDPNYVLGTGDFTIEFWTKFAVIEDNVWIFQLSSTNGPSNPQDMYVIHYGGGMFLGAINGGNTYIYNWFWVPTTGWNHVAIVRQGGTISAYLNGTRWFTTNCLTQGGCNNLNLTGQAVTLGAYYSWFYQFNGYVDDLRITKAVRYDPSQTTAAYPSAEIPNQ